MRIVVRKPRRPYHQCFTSSRQDRLHKGSRKIQLQPLKLHLLGTVWDVALHLFLILYQSKSRRRQQPWPPSMSSNCSHGKRYNTADKLNTSSSRVRHAQPRRRRLRAPRYCGHVAKLALGTPPIDEGSISYILIRKPDKNSGLSLNEASQTRTPIPLRSSLRCKEHSSLRFANVVNLRILTLGRQKSETNQYTDTYSDFRIHGTRSTREGCAWKTAERIPECTSMITKTSSNGGGRPT
jgi:hypothetical protein